MEEQLKSADGSSSSIGSFDTYVERGWPTA